MINCTFENGDKAFLRHAVVDALVIKDGQILLVKRAAGLLEAGKWALPGGFVEHGETTVQAAEREILEETGWTAKNPYTLMINSNPNRPKEDRQNISFIFVFAAVKKTGESDRESEKVKWFSHAALPPAGLIAFDHLDYINLYLKTQKEPVALPVLV